jgi:hypothetical protein
MQQRVFSQCLKQQLGPADTAVLMDRPVAPLKIFCFENWAVVPFVSLGIALLYKDKLIMTSSSIVLKNLRYVTGA